MRRIPEFNQDVNLEEELQMRTQLSPEKMEEMERMHQALLKRHAEMKVKQEEMRQRIMQGDHTMLEEAINRLETTHLQEVIRMTYGIGAPKMTIEQIAEALNKDSFSIRFGLIVAKRKLGEFYCELLEFYAAQTR